MPTGAMTPIVRWQATKNGVAAPGAKLYTWLSGTSTAHPVYTTSALSVARPNPVEADATGLFPVMYLDAVAYRMEMRDSSGVTIWGPQDGVFDFAEVQIAASGGSGLVGFIQSGSGAVARTAQAKMREIVSVTDFNVDPTGVSDSTAGLQAAADAHNTLYIPPGTYKFTAWTLTPSHRIHGAGTANTTLQFTPSTGNGITCVATAGGKGLTIQDLLINSPAQSSGTAIALTAASAPNAHRLIGLRNLIINDFKNGLLVENILHGLIENVRMTLKGSGEAGSYGIRIGDVADSLPGNVVNIVNCYVDTVETAFIQNAVNGKFDTCTVELSGTGFKIGRRTVILNPWSTATTTDFNIAAPNGSATIIGFGPDDTPVWTFVNATARQETIFFPSKQTSGNSARLGDLQFLARGFLIPKDDGIDVLDVGVTANRFHDFYGAGVILSKSPTGGVGYDAGAGGTVIQATSKSTGVELNKVAGQITMNGAALAAGARVTFRLTNSAIAAPDFVQVMHVADGTVGAYTVTSTPGTALADITVTNITAGSLSEAIIIRFFVLKSALT